MEVGEMVFRAYTYNQFGLGKAMKVEHKTGGLPALCRHATTGNKLWVGRILTLAGVDLVWKRTNSLFSAS
jgi:hypothetical protein